MGEWFHRHSPILMEKIMDIRDEIINSMDIMIQKSLEKNRQTNTRVGTVTAIQDGKYQVTIDGATYSMYDSVGCDPQVGQSVLIQTSGGSFLNAFITGLFNKNAEPGGGGGGGGNIVSVGSLPSKREKGTVYLVRGDLVVVS